MERRHEKEGFRILLILLLTVFQSATQCPYRCTPASHLDEHASLPTTIIKTVAP